MKKMLVMTAIALSLSLADQAKADGNGVNGLLLGAGGGALVGQAVARNTKGTLIGAAVGTVIGYALGNEMDKGRGRRTPGFDAYQPPVGYRRPGVERPRVVVVRPETMAECREAEMLATIDGRPEKVYGQVCLQDGEWVGMAEGWTQPVVYETVVLLDRDRRPGHHPPGHQRRDHQCREARDDHRHGRHGRERESDYRPEC